MSGLAPHEIEVLAREAYDSINRGDLDRFLSLIHPNVEFHVLMAEAEGGTFLGHDGVREWWDEVKGTFSDLHFEMEKINASDDRGYIQLVVTGTMAGVAVPQRMWQAFVLRDGLPIWWKSFRTEAEARAAIEESPE